MLLRATLAIIVYLILRIHSLQSRLRTGMAADKTSVHSMFQRRRIFAYKR